MISTKLITWPMGPTRQAGEVVGGDLWTRRRPRNRPRGRRRRAPGRSPGSRASGGAGGRSWGGRSSPEQSSRRRPELGFDGGASYRARRGKGEGGTEAGAHGGLEDVVGELGGDRTATCGRWRSTVAGDEDDEGGDDGGRPEVGGSTRRWRGSWRSSWTPLRGEGMAGSASVASCGGGSASGEREREQGERRRARESESGAGQLRGDVPDVQASRGRTGRQVPWRHGGAHAPAIRLWPPGGRWRTTGASQSAGPACCCWAAQGGSPR